MLVEKSEYVYKHTHVDKDQIEIAAFQTIERSLLVVLLTIKNGANLLLITDIIWMNLPLMYWDFIYT
jgi:hypothetical protein